MCVWARMSYQTECGEETPFIEYWFWSRNRKLRARAKKAAAERPPDERWTAKLVRLHTYLRSHGGRYPIVKTADDVERKLGAWVDRQRMARRGGGTCVMTEARAARLEKLGGWEWDLAPGRVLAFNGVQGFSAAAANSAEKEEEECEAIPRSLANLDKAGQRCRTKLCANAPTPGNYGFYLGEACRLRVLAVHPSTVVFRVSRLRGFAFKAARRNLSMTRYAQDTVLSTAAGLNDRPLPASLSLLGTVRPPLGSCSYHDYAYSLALRCF